MRAVRWHGRFDIRVEEVESPAPRAHEAVIRIERVGLCGSDVEQFETGHTIDPGAFGEAAAGAGATEANQQPMILGHELVGIVEECASRPELVGRRVIPDVVEGCGNCWWCARHEAGLCPNLVVRGQTSDGGLAEWFTCDAATLVVVPGGLSPEVAVFAEPLAVAVRALAKLGEIRGATAAIVGMGVIGNLIGQVCRSRGINVVGIDIAPHRAAQAEAVGIVTVTPDQAGTAVFAATGGRGADVVFECVGKPETFADSGRLCRAGGTVVLLGISDEVPPFAWRDAVLREITYVGSAAHMWDTDVQSAVNLLAAGTIKVTGLTSRVIGLGEVAEVLRELTEPNELAKVVVDPSRD